MEIIVTRLEHSWCNVHSVTPLHPEQVPDESADVFDAVSAREEFSIDYFNLNLNLKAVNMNEIKNDQLATQLEQVVHRRHTYSGPQDIIEKHLPDVSNDYYARVTNSLAWRMDAAVIFGARTVLFDLYADDEIANDQTPREHFIEFCENIDTTLSHDSMFELNQACMDLVALMRLRLDWHDIAQAAAHANDRDYNPKTLGEMLVNEKPMKVRVETRANYELLAERAAKGDPKKKSEIMDRLIKRDEMMNEQRVDDNKRLIPFIERIIATAERHVPVHASIDDLDKRFGRSLIDFTMATLERIAESDVARDKKVSQQMFIRILDAQDKCIEELKELRDQRFSESDDLENVRSQASIDHEKRMKELAINDKLPS